MPGWLVDFRLKWGAWLIVGASALLAAPAAAGQLADSDASAAAAGQLERLIADVPPAATGRAYFHATDDRGKQLGALDPIVDPAGGYLGVYHSPYPWGRGMTFRISLAHSDDLLHWTRIRTLDRNGASMPTLQRIPGTGGYLLAYEKKPLRYQNVVRIAYFRSRRDLVHGLPAEQRNLPRRFSPYANGTPTILWIRWRGSAARSLVGLGFHYQSEAARRPSADREAVGVLAGLRRWSTIKGDEADAALFSQSLHGNHGDWRQFSFEGFRWRVYEGQERYDDFATWHVLLYNPRSRAVRRLSLHVGTARLTSVGNPIARLEPGPKAQGQVLVVTAFVFNASAPGLTGELVYYQPLQPAGGQTTAPGITSPPTPPAPAGAGAARQGSARLGPPHARPRLRHARPRPPAPAP